MNAEQYALDPVGRGRFARQGVLVPDDPERLEAEIRKLMARHASTAPRGFDSNRQRHALHREIDSLLDRLSIAVEVARLDADLTFNAPVQDS